MNGLELITPTSVDGSGVSLSGAKVVFASATSISINGIFSSNYDNYLFVIRYVHEDYFRGVNMRMRLSGTDDAGSNYAYQRLQASGSSVSGARTTSFTQAEISGVDSANISGAHVYVYGPALAQPTAIRGMSVVGYLGGTIYDQAATHTLSTAYDGCTINNNLNSMTGSLTIYGFTKQSVV